MAGDAVTSPGSPRPPAFPLIQKGSCSMGCRNRGLRAFMLLLVAEPRSLVPILILHEACHDWSVPAHGLLHAAHRLHNTASTNSADICKASCIDAGILSLDRLRLAKTPFLDVTDCN